MRPRRTPLGSLRGLVAAGLLSGALLGMAAIAVRTLWPWIKPEGIPGEPELTGAPKDSAELAARRLEFPVRGLSAETLTDSFDERRGKAKHEALDIMARRGTPVLAVDDGRVVKLFRSVPGGITLYQFDAAETVAYYYAHLDGYAPGLAEGAAVKRGDLIGFVGSTGNAPASAPHLHFAVFELGAERKWWKGKAVNPYAWLKE